MSSKKAKAEKPSKYDLLKWILVVLLIIAGIGANYYFTQEPLSLRLVGWLVLACVVIVIALQTAKGKQVWKFFHEARNEIRKVVWPNRKQTLQTTLMVLAVVVIFAIVMWGLDVVLMVAIGWLTGQRG
jgi:preprotein translocase subunit SecE